MAASITIAVVQDKNATHYQFSRLSLIPARFRIMKPSAMWTILIS